MNEIGFYIEKLLNYFNVTTISDLAEVMEIKQSSISSWKIRNSISAIRTQCIVTGKQIGRAHV